MGFLNAKQQQTKNTHPKDNKTHRTHVWVAWARAMFYKSLEIMLNTYTFLKFTAGLTVRHRLTATHCWFCAIINNRNRVHRPPDNFPRPIRSIHGVRSVARPWRPCPRKGRVPCHCRVDISTLLSLPESQSLLPTDNFARVVEVCKPLGEPMISANVAFLGSPVQDAPKQGEMVRNALIQELGKDFEISVEPKWVRILPIGQGGYYWEWMVTIRRQ